MIINDSDGKFDLKYKNKTEWMLFEIHLVLLFYMGESSWNWLESAKNTILLVDQTKFFHTGFYKINQLSAYKTIISDAAPDPKMLVAAEDCGTEWIY